MRVCRYPSGKRALEGYQKRQCSAHCAKSALTWGPERRICQVSGKKERRERSEESADSSPDARQSEEAEKYSEEHPLGDAGSEKHSRRDLIGLGGALENNLCVRH